MVMYSRVRLDGLLINFLSCHSGIAQRLSSTRQRKHCVRYQAPKTVISAQQLRCCSFSFPLRSLHFGLQPCERSPVLRYSPTHRLKLLEGMIRSHFACMTDCDTLKEPDLHSWQTAELFSDSPNPDKHAQSKNSSLPGGEVA